MSRPARTAGGKPVTWLFDLDNTLHDASHAAFGDLSQRMTDYIVQELGLAPADADALRRRYWLRYGATLLGLVRHHGVDADHFLHHTHLLPGLEARVRGHRHDIAALRRLPGAKWILTNAPAHYTARVLGVLGIGRLFDGVIAVEGMRMFGHVRPKPDTRMLRHVAARLQVPPRQCVLVEDTPGHLKAARSIGMRTVWMQRWTRAAVRVAAAAAADGGRGAGDGPALATATATATQLMVRAGLHSVPAYIDQRVLSFVALARGWDTGAAAPAGADDLTG